MRTPSRDRRAAVLTGCSVAAIIAATLSPFVLDLHRVTWAEFAGAFGVAPASLLDFPRNVLLFVPLGWGVVTLVHLRGRSWRTAILVAGAIGVATSLAVETLQIFLPGRTTNLSDIVGNALGTLGGAALCRSWRLRPADAVPRMARRATRLSAVAFPLYLLLMLGLVWSLMSGVRPSRWIESDRLVPGNAFPHARPWRGQVEDLLVLDRAVDETAAAQLLAGRIPAGFEDALVPEHQPGSSAVASRVNKSREFTVVVTVTTFNLDQPDVAPFVRSSSRTSAGNLALLQDGGRLVMRWRSPLTLSNDMTPELEFPGVFTSLAPMRMVISFDGSLARVRTPQTDIALFVSPEAVFSAMLREVNVWAVSPARLEWWVLAAPLSAVMFLPIGALLAMSVHEALRTKVWTVGVLLPALLVEGFIATYRSAPPRVEVIGLGIVLTVLGFAALFTFRRNGTWTASAMPACAGSNDERVFDRRGADQYGLLSRNGHASCPSTNFPHTAATVFREVK